MAALQHIRDITDLDVEITMNFIHRSRVYGNTRLGMRIRLMRREDRWEGKSIIVNQMFVNEAGE